MATTGRPRKEINKESFEKLCGLQCTKEEIADFFDCSEDTIDRWCKREYKITFAAVFKKKSAAGRISLRRHAFRMAEKNPGVLIFLMKNYLGLRDNPALAEDENAEGDGFLEALSGTAAEDWADEK